MPAAFDASTLIATLPYRRQDELPGDLANVPLDAILMLDATVYIDAGAGRLKAALSARLAGSEILHCAVSVGEIAASLGLLDPNHPGTPAVQRALNLTLERIDPFRTVAPSPAAWKEGSIIAGALARTQYLHKDGRRKLLNDALMFLAAEESGAVLISRNVRDMDLLLQLRPAGRVLLYERG